MLRLLPSVVTWGLWLACNAGMFYDKAFPPFKVVQQSMALLSIYKGAHHVGWPRDVGAVGYIDHGLARSIAWTIFLSSWNWISREGDRGILSNTTHLGQN